jgi:hypothetical protein
MKITYVNKILYLIGALSLFVSFYFNIDSAGSGGFISDFRITWPLVERPFNFHTDFDIKFPLHYLIASLIYFLVGDKELLRVTYCVIAIFAPFLFFVCLKKKYTYINENNLFLFSLIIFLLPSFRSAAIFPNTQITGIFFFLISLYFFLNWEIKKEFNHINRDLFLLIFFMALTVYVRQLYAMIFLYFVLVFFSKQNIKTFIQSCLLIAFFALPGVIFVYFWPMILKATFDYKIYNSLLVNSSIISFFLIPFFSIIYLFEEKISFKKKEIFFLILVTVFVLLCSNIFDYNYLLGGGFFIKLSKLVFGNLYFFYLTSIIGFLLLFILCQESHFNSLIIIILLFSFSAYIIFMKYFEPMFIFILFFLIKTKFTGLFLQNKRNIYLYHLYFLIYLTSGITNSIFLLTK